MLLEVSNETVFFNITGEHDVEDFETAFFMELLESYRDVLLNYGLSKEKVVQKVTSFTVINIQNFFKLIGEYEKILKKTGMDEVMIDGKLGGYIQAYGCFSNIYNREITGTLAFIKIKKSILNS